MREPDFDGRVAAIRCFNRFYTEKIGVLQEGILHSPFSLTEARVLFELAGQEQSTAREIGKALELDEGYLSRLLQKFERRGLINKKRSPQDGRQTFISLTAEGRQAFGQLDRRSSEEVAAFLEKLPSPAQRRLIGAMGAIETLLGSGPGSRTEPYVLRTHRPGDIGWVVERHGTLYAHEYGWDEQFEALVAEIAARFIHHLDPQRERCWIAERDGENVGCAFLVKHSDKVAKLRLLLVDPKARGLGIGRRLVSECIRFAHQAGYQSITLWTNSVLLAARHIYQNAGFRVVREEPHHSFGHDLVGETWELPL